MKKPALKVLLPHSLYARAVLILLVPVITILLVVSAVFFQRLYENVTRQMTEAVAQEIRLVLLQIETGGVLGNSVEAALEVAAPLGIELTGDGIGIEDRREWIDFSGRVVIESLRDDLEMVTGVDLVARDGFARIGIMSSQGALALDIPRRRLSARNPHQFLVLMGFTAILMTAIALLYLRNQVRPIRRLARAADAFGKGRSVPYRPSGATEVRQAGAAFLDMRDRIERQIEQRTLMLSGVSHDLRSPLTRMKLGVSLMEESEETKALLTDVTDMERMLEAFLDFARGEGPEAAVLSDPSEIVSEAYARSRRGELNVELGEIQPSGSLRLRRDSIARALDNLIVNAVRYGERAALSFEANGEVASFVVDDAGPGIAEDQRELAMKPFSRLDGARNQDSGSGVGLGLAITADIARNHGGSLVLEKSPLLGGLRAKIVIPI